jgi:hypothetical protein
MTHLKIVYYEEADTAKSIESTSRVETMCEEIASERLAFAEGIEATYDFSGPNVPEASGFALS